MVFNATFNNISVISRRSVVLVEETTDLPQRTDKLYHIMLYRVGVLIAWAGFELMCVSGGFLSSTNKTDRRDITEILLNVTLNTIKQATNQPSIALDE